MYNLWISPWWQSRRSVILNTYLYQDLRMSLTWLTEGDDGIFFLKAKRRKIQMGGGRLIGDIQKIIDRIHAVILINVKKRKKTTHRHRVISEVNPVSGKVTIRVWIHHFVQLCKNIWINHSNPLHKTGCSELFESCRLLIWIHFTVWKSTPRNLKLCLQLSDYLTSRFQVYFQGKRNFQKPVTF